MAAQALSGSLAQASLASAARPAQQPKVQSFRPAFLGQVTAPARSSSFHGSATFANLARGGVKASRRSALTTQAKTGHPAPAQSGWVLGGLAAIKAPPSNGSFGDWQSSWLTAIEHAGVIGDTLEEFLVQATDDDGLRQVMMSMAEAIRTIAFKVKTASYGAATCLGAFGDEQVRTASCGAANCVNTFGDEQLAVDLLADKLLFEALKYSGKVKFACSEEVPEPVDLQGSGFSVAFDPLDGSSIVDTNFTVGTIFGVWPGDKLTGVTGRDQAGAGMGIYGPRTVYCLALKDAPGCHEFLLQDDGKWLHVKETTEIGEGKMFSPGNLRATFDNPNYERLISHYIGEKYTLRYTGGMVPDVFQIIVKEKGVFTNVISPSTKAKLRILFEVAPLSLLVEKAGGFSSCDGLCVSGLDVNIEKHDQRTQICYGSKAEVQRFEEYMYGNSPRFAEMATDYHDK